MQAPTSSLRACEGRPCLVPDVFVPDVVRDDLRRRDSDLTSRLAGAAAACTARRAAAIKSCRSDASPAAAGFVAPLAVSNAAMRSTTDGVRNPTADPGSKG
jgi:hypothetical protein